MLANPDIGVTQIAHRLGVSPATLSQYIPAARTANTPSAWQRPLYPKDRALQEGFSPAARGGSAPIPAVRRMTIVGSSRTQRDIGRAGSER
jgi:hypothetical protein